MARAPHRARTRNVVGLAGAAALALALPLGHFTPYRSRALGETTFARVCSALPGGVLEHALAVRVRTSEVAGLKPRAEVENLFPSVSRTACEYNWKPACTRRSALRSLIVIVATMPEPSQALGRYSYARELLHQDSLNGNDFNDSLLAGRRAYELTIEDEVLVRVLDGNQVIDMHYHLCAPIGGPPAQAVVNPIVAHLRLPILSTRTSPGPLRPLPY